VPLILRWPKNLPAGRRVEQFVQHMDFAPSLLKWAGAEVPANMEGKDFSGLAEGKTEEILWDRVVCCENTWQSKWAVRTDRYKFILSRKPDHHGMPLRELYDLQEDPTEQCNLIDANPVLAQELEAWLENWIDAGLSRGGRSVDPLCAQEITLGKRWDEWLNRASKI
jgi:arylsulfatase A-like enzyme